MALLDRMRAGTDSTFMQVVLGLVVISFVAWYAKPNGEKAESVAYVNGKPITSVAFGRRFQNIERNQEATRGHGLTESEETSLKEAVKKALVEEEVARQMALKLGLQVSDEEMARALLSNPAFLNKGGEFDHDSYEAGLRQMGFSQADYEEDERNILLREKLRDLVAEGTAVSDPILKDAYVRTATRIDIEYVRINPAHFLDKVDVGDDKVDAYVKDNKQAIDDAYKADFERKYNLPEKLHLRMIRLGQRSDGVQIADLAKRMNDLKALVDGGADFKDLAAKWSEDLSAGRGGDVGTLPVTDLPPEVKAALEKLQPGQVSDVVTTDDQVRLYRLEERIPASVIAEDAVQRDIAKGLLRDEQVKTLAPQFADKLLAAAKEKNAIPEDLLDAEGLRVEETGPMPMSGLGTPFGPPKEMVEAAVRATPGQVLPEVYEAGDPVQKGSMTLFVGVLRDRTDPDMTVFDTKKDHLRDQVLLVAREQLYEGWLQDQVARAKVTQ